MRKKRQENASSSKAVKSEKICRFSATKTRDEIIIALRNSLWHGINQQRTSNQRHSFICQMSFSHENIGSDIWKQSCWDSRCERLFTLTSTAKWQVDRYRVSHTLSLFQKNVNWWHINIRRWHHRSFGGRIRMSMLCFNEKKPFWGYFRRRQRDDGNERVKICRNKPSSRLQSMLTNCIDHDRDIVSKRGNEAS